MRLHLPVTDCLPPNLLSLAVRACDFGVNQLISNSINRNLLLSLHFICERNHDLGFVGVPLKGRQPNPVITLNLFNITPDNLTTTIFHEITHLQQILTRRLYLLHRISHHSLVYYFDGQLFRKQVKYADQPWEIEANQCADALYRRFTVT